MNKDLPGIFKNKNERKIENNKRIFYSKYEDTDFALKKENNDNKKVPNKGLNYSDTINNLLGNSQFVFNVPVEITTKEKTIQTKIVSKVGSHIMTTSGEVIELSDIVTVKVIKK